MEEIFLRRLFKEHSTCGACPSPVEVGDFFSKLLGALFPNFSHESFSSFNEFKNHLLVLEEELRRMILLMPENEKLRDGQDLAGKFYEALPAIHDQLQHDVDSIYRGDPSAKSHSEVIRTYPGFYAVAAYRVAHKLYSFGVDGIPRMIAEHAHSKTGIDIHPAAKIGGHFCIDHGTGIVIGETTIIGDFVKIYQGVTLGALSVNKSDADKKRHPTIHDRVVIYAGATILGGDTVIGHDSVIGGNVFLTSSVAPHSKIYYQPKMQREEMTQLNFKSEV
jgi:serine O-acetyltransferase